MMQSVKGYFFAFLASLILTLASYALAVGAQILGLGMLLLLGFLGLSQVWIQLYVFVNLGNEEKPRWNLMLFLFAVLITLFLVIGSLWIMIHLNYNLEMSH